MYLTNKMYYPAGAIALADASVIILCHDWKS